MEEGRGGGKVGGRGKRGVGEKVLDYCSIQRSIILTNSTGGVFFSVSFWFHSKSSLWILIHVS